MNTFKQLVAECTGTFILVFLGVGSVLVNAITQGGVGIVGIALAFGFGAMLSVYAFSSVSGAHINPAVTISLWASKKINTLKSLGYIASQLVGATLAATGLWIIFGSRDLVASGVTFLRPGVTGLQGIFLEAVLTFFLMTAVLAFIKQDFEKQRELHGGILIGLVIAADIIIGGVLTGASMNPARTFGPALVSDAWIGHYVYWVGPIIGGLAAVLVNKVFSFWKT